MYIPEKMKLNKFRLCSIPRNRDYFVRYGFAAPGSNSFTGDELAPMPSNKIEQVASYVKFIDRKEEELNNPKPNKDDD